MEKYSLKMLRRLVKNYSKSEIYLHLIKVWSFSTKYYSEALDDKEPDLSPEPERKENIVGIVDGLIGAEQVWPTLFAKCIK